jgi:hypothetical protein
MRTILAVLVLLCACMPLCARGQDSISPGARLSTVKSTLQKHGYEVNSVKYGLAMAAPKNHGLEFCRIDDNITLVIQYELATQKVTSLGVIIISDYSRSKLDRVSRDILEITLHKDGIYTLKMKRAVEQASQSRK